MKRPRLGLRSQLLAGLLAGLLGFALVVQVRTTQRTSGLSAARQEDLVRILDDLTARSDRLRAEIADLERTRDKLTSGVGQDAAALEEARRREEVLAILAGTAAARGPGIVLTITDPDRSVTAEVLLDALQELRDAGAEAVQVGDVRLVASSYFTDAEGGVVVDGRLLSPPYRFVAVGDTHTLADAMTIPGGVIDVVAAKTNARAIVERRDAVVVDALRPLSEPRYARPAAGRAGP
jgi:uncharacterized protein YlxW (UPF0749 family)